MEIVAEKLEALITCAENSLNSIEVQLETELTKQSGMQLNPVSLFKAIEDSKKELAELRKEMDSLVKEQEDIKEKLTEKVQILCRQLQDMENKLGASGNSLSSNADSVMKSHLRM